MALSNTVRLIWTYGKWWLKVGRPQQFQAKLKKGRGLLLPPKTHSDKDRQLLFLGRGRQGSPPQVPQFCGLSSGRRHRRSEGAGQGLRGGAGREDEDGVL